MRLITKEGMTGIEPSEEDEEEQTPPPPVVPVTLVPL